jgi:DNA-binding NarL/FixJ family response regulator
VTRELADLLAPDITRRLIEQFVRRPPPGSAVPPALGELTPREVEVLRLVARGLSNAEFAGELVVGETTVRTHVTRILAKLGARDRVQAVVAATNPGSYSQVPASEPVPHARGYIVTLWVWCARRSRRPPQAVYATPC